jgi:methionyl-tRNA formyltransferase
MTIEFLTQDDPLYILPFFDEFFRHYGGQFDIAQISSCPIMGKRSRGRLIRELSYLYGVPGFVRLGMRSVGNRLLGSIRKPQNASRYYSLRQVAQAYGVPYVLVADPNSEEYRRQLAGRATDLLVSVACPIILKAPVLGIPRLGCINIHHAPLPRYKGMMPTFWQMYHQEKSVGVTIHYMTEKLDDGDALLQEESEIRPGETLDQLIQRSKRHGAHCMARVLKEFIEGTTRRTPLDHSKGSYFTFPTADQVATFRRNGYRAI